MTAPRRAAAHPRLLAVIIGGLVLAGVIALFTVLGGADRSSGAATSHRAADGPAATTSAAPTSATPSSSAATSSAAPAKTSAPATKPASTPTSTKAAPNPSPATARRSITYVVKRGDTLDGIAKWFHQHGYGALYDRNKHVIGKNPNLIFPGQRITISDGKMAVGR